MSKQTAVDWLIDQVEDYIGLIPTDIINQAKAMERQQIEEAAEKESEYLADYEDKESYQKIFIEGAKSKAARDYWFEQFKKKGGDK